MTIRYTPTDGVATITIDRPEVLNAVRTQDLEALTTAVQDAQEDTDVRVVVINGTERAFSVGSDIKVMDGMSESDFEIQTAHFQDLARAMRGCPKPIIGAINGYCLGGGFEIALLCDIRMASESALLGLPDAELGFSPSGGLTWLLPRLIGQSRAMHLMLTGEMIKADEAERIGLVTKVVPDDELDSAVEALATTMAGWPSVGLANTKLGVAAAMDNEFLPTLETEARLDAESFGSEETKSKLRAFLESRKK